METKQKDSSIGGRDSIPSSADDNNTHKAEARVLSHSHRKYRPHRPDSDGTARRYYLPGAHRPAHGQPSSEPIIAQSAPLDDVGDRLPPAPESDEYAINHQPPDSHSGKHHRTFSFRRLEFHSESDSRRREKTHRRSQTVLVIMALLLTAITVVALAYASGKNVLVDRGIFDVLLQNAGIMSEFHPNAELAERISAFEARYDLSPSDSDASSSDALSPNLPEEVSFSDAAVFTSPSNIISIPAGNSADDYLDLFLLSVKAGFDELYSISRGIYLYSTVEAGADSLDPSIFSRREGQNLLFASEPSPGLLRTPGCYTLQVVSGGRPTNVVLNVVDTTPPEVTLKALSAWIGDEITPESFVVSVSDVSPIVLQYTYSEPDPNLEGEQPVTLTASDIYGNVRDPLSVVLTLTADTVAPVINGAKNRTFTVGSDVLYKKDITLTDNRDSESEIRLDVDASRVNPGQAGSYDVIYTATDRAGNSSSVTVRFTFITQEEFDLEQELDVYVRKVADRIFKDGMSDAQKVRAIYNWCRGSLGYTGNSIKDNWKSAALLGFKKGGGDCYTYFACAKALLEYCGIENIDIEKRQTNVSHSHHYWNLVNVGTGYYHLDCTPRVGGFYGFMLTDAQLAAYSKANYDSHAFDPSLYPATPTEKFEM